MKKSKSKSFELNDNRENFRALNANWKKNPKSTNVACTLRNWFFTKKTKFKPK